MRFMITIYISIIICAVGMRGYELHQTQQATLGIHSDRYTGSSVTQEIDAKRLFLDKLHKNVMSGIKNTVRKYNIQDKENGVNGNQQYVNTNETLSDTNTKKVVATVSTRKKRQTPYECYDENDYNPFNPLLNVQKESTTATYVAKIVDIDTIKSDFHYYVYNLQNAQKSAIELLQKILDAANPIIDKLNYINTIIKQLQRKKITYIVFQEQLVGILCQLNKKIKAIENLLESKGIDLVLLYDKILEYDEKITKNILIFDSVINLTKDIMKIGDDVKKLIGDFTILHESLKLKYEKEITDYTNTIVYLEKEKASTDKTMSKYNEYLTTITHEITDFNEEKEKLNYNLGLLQNCMKKKDDFIVELTKLEEMYCQKTDDIDKQNLTLKKKAKENTCDIDDQQTVKNVLHAIIEKYCAELHQNEAKNMIVQTAELKQCDVEKCEETKEIA